MGKNIMFLILGAVLFSVFAERPIFAKGTDLTNAAFAISSRELAIVDRAERVVYYYEKSNGLFLRAHKIDKFGTSLIPQ